MRRKKGDGKGTQAMKSLDLESFWSRLPAFRVVAEHGSLPAASQLLRLSPSAISRSIHLLEEDLGRPLFSRDGGRLQLTSSGKCFLEAVRRSMRLVDDGATALRGEEHAGPFRLSAPAALLGAIAVEVVRRERGEHPGWTFSLSCDGDARGVVSGIVDVAVVVAPGPPSDELEVHALGEVAMGVYCGRAHPLWARQQAPVPEVLAQPFLVSADSTLVAGWPAHWRTTTALELVGAEGAVAACVASLGLAALPCAMVAAPVAAGTLRQLLAVVVPPLRLHALRRPLLAADRARLVIDRLASVVRDLPGATL
ncbi:MAG: LysR family transcriptional regulator [Polyangiaceae bacterium]